MSVSFPCVHGASSGELNGITCFRSNELKGILKVVSAVDEEGAKRVVGAARHSERSEHAAYGVIALFDNPMFSGQSYSLALALADKMARYGSTDRWAQIAATGRIPVNGNGAVEAVQGITEKIEIVAKLFGKGSLFVFPKDNLEGGNREVVRDRLAMLEEKEIQWRAVEDLVELEDDLWPSTNTTHHKAKLGLPEEVGKTVGSSGGHQREHFNWIVAIVSIFFVLLLIGLAMNTVKEQKLQSVVSPKLFDSPQEAEEIVMESVSGGDIPSDRLEAEVVPTENTVKAVTTPSRTDISVPPIRKQFIESKKVDSDVY